MAQQIKKILTILLFTILFSYCNTIDGYIEVYTPIVTKVEYFDGRGGSKRARYYSNAYKRNYQLDFVLIDTPGRFNIGDTIQLIQKTK
jgi:hypothetical protein